MNSLAKIYLLIAAVNGLMAVVLGAFGAHALKSRLTESLLSAWQTGVQYHFYHVLALLGLGILINGGLYNKYASASGAFFSIGIVLFCGSLYWLALGGPRWLGPITPLGGLCFIIAWLNLGVAIWQST